MQKQHFFKALVCSMALCTVFSLCGCGDSDSNESSPQTKTPTTVSTSDVSSSDSGSTAAESSPEESTEESTLVESSAEEVSKEEYKDPEYTLGTIVASGNCGKDGGNATYQLDDKGLLVISGSGEMKNYTYNYNARSSDAPWFDKKESIKTVILKE